MKIGFISCFDYIRLDEFEQFGFDKVPSLLDFDLLLWDIGYLHFGYYFGHLSGYLRDRSSDFRDLLKDRQRRLNELHIFLDSGRTLIVLLSEINHLRQKIAKNLDRIEGALNEEGLSPENFDAFSFLPAGLEKIIRGNVVGSRGKRIDFKGDEALFPTWKALHRVAWYQAYFTKSIGTPFLFISGTQVPVATWLPYLNGNVFFIPATEYDDTVDFPEFVKAAKLLKLGLDNLTGNLIEVPWQAMEGISFEDVEFESLEVPSNSTNAIPKRHREDLRRKIANLFNATDVRNLCFDLNIKYEDVSISGGRISDTVREIVLLCERNGILNQLIAWCQKERPNEDWSEFI